MDTSFLNKTQLELFNWVVKAHGEQKRKYTNEPYITHCLEVAKIIHDNLNVPKYLGFSNRLMMPIALCHDILEDTKFKSDDLFFILDTLDFEKAEMIFIIEAIQHLTKRYTKEKYPELNRLQRTIHESIRLSKCNPMTQTVKYADIISNTSTIRRHDPLFAKNYLTEKLITLTIACDGAEILYNKALDLVKNGK